MIFNIEQKIGKKEKATMKDLYEDIQNPRLKKRIQSCAEWYIEYAALYKGIFYTLSITGIVLPVLVTIINATDTSGKTTAVTLVLSSIIAMCTSLLTFSKCREKWGLYRSSVEMIKRELMLYWGRKETDQDLKDLIVTLEKCMENEHMQWLKILKEIETEEGNSTSVEENK